MGTALLGAFGVSGSLWTADAGAGLLASTGGEMTGVSALIFIGLVILRIILAVSRASRADDDRRAFAGGGLRIGGPPDATRRAANAAAADALARSLGGAGGGRRGNEAAVSPDGSAIPFAAMAGPPPQEDPE